MKVNLVVASGAHQGKIVSITGPQFLIGRDAQCHLRPASQAISKHHCGVLVRDGQIYIKDFGSTNGTIVNDVLVRAAEVAVVDGATLKLGPLDFIVRIEFTTPNPDGTPLSDTPETAAALAAVKAATGAVPGSKNAPVRDATPNPGQARKPSKPAPSSASKATPVSTGSKETAALNSSEAKPDVGEDTVVSNSNLTANEDDDKMAAMLLGMEDDKVPDGSTVVELPAVDSQGKPLPPADGKADDKSGKKPVQSREEMSSAASDLLRKMMRRPK